MAKPTHIIVGWLRADITKTEVVRIICNRVSNIRPITTVAAYTSHGAYIQADRAATGMIYDFY